MDDAPHECEISSQSEVVSSAGLNSRYGYQCRRFFSPSFYSINGVEDLQMIMNPFEWRIKYRRAYANE